MAAIKNDMHSFHHMHSLSEAQFDFEAVAIEQDDLKRFQSQIVASRKIVPRSG